MRDLLWGVLFHHGNLRPPLAPFAVASFVGLRRILSIDNQLAAKAASNPMAKPRCGPAHYVGPPNGTRRSSA